MVGEKGGIILEQDNLIEFCEKLVDHITVIEGFLQLDSEKKVIKLEIHELKSTVLGFIDELVCNKLLWNLDKN